MSKRDKHRRLDTETISFPDGVAELIGPDDLTEEVIRDPETGGVMVPDPHDVSTAPPLADLVTRELPMKALADAATRALPRPPRAYEVARRVLHESCRDIAVHDIDIVEDRAGFKHAWQVTARSAGMHGNLTLVATASALARAADSVAADLLVECLVSTAKQAFDAWVDAGEGRIIAVLSRPDLEVESL